ncbi:MAG: hypothetical protein H6710_09210 [Myxococcales bacterium]|nr:hypothetical protein [Myxococcales bacterium]
MSADTKNQDSLPQVTTVAYGFNGSYGLLMAFLPVLVYYLWICNDYYGGSLVVPTSWAELREFFGHVAAPTWKAAAIYGGWFGFQLLLQVFAPGKWVKGAELDDGKRLDYKMNGWFSWWATLAVAAGLVLTGALPATILYDEFAPLLTVVNIFSFAFSGYLYLHGKLWPQGEKIRGQFFYDYFMGTSLNPRIGPVDWKLFCEARPGLILWVLINFSIAAKQYSMIGTVTTPMILVCAFQFWYILDYYYHEEAILSTWDIRHERFGFMLAWGDLAWLPFTYVFQAMYLLHHPFELSLWGVMGLVTLNMIGYTIFRGANIQKHRFRKDPERPIMGRPAEYIKTARGPLLLTSGWWGMARHINYCGDLIMALTWCMCTGFNHIVPYFYIIYFSILLIHRERRDNAFCAAKYGKDWEAYQAKVPYRIFPYIY